MTLFLPSDSTIVFAMGNPILSHSITDQNPEFWPLAQSILKAFTRCWEENLGR
jgi:hypothetical protein